VAAQYLLPADHPSPHRVKDRLDAIIARDLPRTVARAFEPWFSETDQSIWIIRRLNIETAINVTGEPERITRALATQIARNLAAMLHSDNQDNVRYFRTRAEYLASFLSDLAFGTAWSQWYYQAFTGLNALPLSGALRTAICDDSRIGREALCLLPVAEILQVVQSLTEHDARLVLERLALEDPESDDWRRKAALRATTEYDTASAKLGERQRALYSLIAASHELRAVSKDEDRSSRGAADPNGPAPVHPRNTAFGGTFLILPYLDELPLVEATRNWPQAEETAAISLVRFLVLLKCCGSEDWERAFYDPLLRNLLLIPPDLSPDMLRSWQSQLKREDLQNFFDTLMDWQRSRDAIRRKEQLLVVSLYRGRPLLVLIDAARGLWLLIDRYSRHRRQDITAALRPALVGLMEEQGVLYSDPSLIDLLQANFTGLRVINLSDHTIDRAGADKPRLDTILTRLDKLPEELEFLTLPQSFEVAPPVDVLLSIVAQHLLRGFAYRLPGFAGSNLPYLFGNFFDFAATLEEEPARRIVRLGRPPLHLVLNMTGLNRQSYRLSWLDERPFALFNSE
jgi:hypothetical protein